MEAGESNLPSGAGAGGGARRKAYGRRRGEEGKEGAQSRQPDWCCKEKGAIDVRQKRDRLFGFGPRHLAM